MSQSEEKMALAKTRAQMIATVLRYQGTDAAEQKLSEIAGAEGDEAVMEIAPHLSAVDVRNVTSEADVVKPSLLHSSIAPEQFRGIFRRVGAEWSSAEQEDCQPYTLQGFQEELKQFFCAFVLLNEDEIRRIELLKAVLEEPHGLDALAFSVIHEKDFPEFVASTSQTADFGDWREIIGIVRTNMPDQWERFLRITSFGDDHEKYIDFVHETAAEIFAVAVSEGAAKRTEQKEAENLFTPLS